MRKRTEKKTRQIIFFPRNFHDNMFFYNLVLHIDLDEFHRDFHSASIRQNINRNANQ